MAESEISVDRAALDAAISKLIRLKNHAYISSQIHRPAISGGGEYIGVLEELSVFYKSMFEELITLLGNTTGFLYNLSKSFSESDENAQDSYQK